jgi:hypothetical protein
MASKIEVYLRSVEGLPFKTFVSKGVVHTTGKLDFTRDAWIEDTTENLIRDAKGEAINLGANAIIGVEFKDTLIEGTK